MDTACRIAIGDPCVPVTDDLIVTRAAFEFDIIGEVANHRSADREGIVLRGPDDALNPDDGVGLTGRKVENQTGRETVDGPASRHVHRYRPKCR